MTAIATANYAPPTRPDTHRTLREIAEFYGIDRRNVLKWIQQGKVVSTETTEGMHIVKVSHLLGYTRAGIRWFNAAL